MCGFGFNVRGLPARKITSVICLLNGQNFPLIKKRVAENGCLKQLAI